jgi:hypothetical protein
VSAVKCLPEEKRQKTKNEINAIFKQQHFSEFQYHHIKNNTLRFCFDAAPVVPAPSLLSAGPGRKNKKVRMQEIMEQYALFVS